MRVVTFNVRYGSADDAEFAWPNRRKPLLDLLEQLDPDILCLQETLYFQLEEIADRLRHFDWIGVGRDDGASSGEFASIFLKGPKPVRSGTFWLSPTPEVPGSMGWGARLPRICTWAELDGLTVANVHLDHESILARKEGVALVLDRLPAHCLLCGDFNATPDEASIQSVLAAGFTDFAAGTGGTYNDFKENPPDPPRIDYIFGRGLTCRKTEVVRHPLVSDHWPVFAEIDLLP